MPRIGGGGQGKANLSITVMIGATRVAAVAALAPSAINLDPMFSRFQAPSVSTAIMMWRDAEKGYKDVSLGLKSHAVAGEVEGLI